MQQRRQLLNTEVLQLRVDPANQGTVIKKLPAHIMLRAAQLKAAQILRLINGKENSDYIWLKRSTARENSYIENLEEFDLETYYKTDRNFKTLYHTYNILEERFLDLVENDQKKIKDKLAASRVRRSYYFN